MRITWRCLIAVIAILAAAAAVASTAGQAQPRPAYDFPELFAKSLRPGMTLGVFLEIRRLEFRLLDANHDDAVSPADHVLQLEVDNAALRAGAMALMLRADLDGDGALSREELEQFEYARARIAIRGDGETVEAARRKAVADAVAARMRFDRNQDGRLDWAEIIAAAQAEVDASARVPPLDPLYWGMLALDENGDGKTSWDEYQKFAEAFFRTVDSDGDGTVSRDEIEANRQRTGFGPPPDVLAAPPPTRPEPRIACALPAAPADARIVVFKSKAGEGLSTAAVGSQDRATYTSAVTIEPGAEPLYLVLATSRPTIWQFDGAVDRVVKAVLLSLLSSNDAAVAAGATGLARDLVAFGSGACGPMMVGIAELQRANDRAAFKRIVGREPDAVAASPGAWRLKLPSGEVEPAREPNNDAGTEKTGTVVVIKRSRGGEGTFVFPGGSRVVIGTPETGSRIMIEQPELSAVDRMRADFAHHNPAGVVPIDPAAVVAGQPVVTYEVLPDRAGLIQLLENGTLEVNGSGEFLVKRKTRYPAELPDSRSMKFLILKGVPVPDGDPGDATVASEDTGALICKPNRCP